MLGRNKYKCFLQQFLLRQSALGEHGKHVLSILQEYSFKGIGTIQKGALDKRIILCAFYVEIFANKAYRDLLKTKGIFSKSR